MKKAVYYLLFLFLILTLSSCNIIDKQAGRVELESESFEVSKEQYDNIRNQYNMVNTRKVLIDNYDDYKSLYIKVNNKYLDANNQISDKSFFKKNVKLCYARMTKGKNTVLHHYYFYLGDDKSVHSSYTSVGFTGNLPEYEETDIKYFFDIVDVPKRIYKKLS